MKDEFFAWRVFDGVRYTAPFDPFTEEFNVFELEFDSADVANEWLSNYFEDEDGIPTDYRLVHYIGTPV